MESKESANTRPVVVRRSPAKPHDTSWNRKKVQARVLSEKREEEDMKQELLNAPPPPSPQPIYPVIGNLPQLKFDMLHIPFQVNRLYNEIGSDTIGLALFGPRPVARTRSLAAVDVLSDKENFGKYIMSRSNFGLGIFEEFLGEGLASIDDGPQYKEMRKLMNPAFRKITTDGMVKDFLKVALNMVDYIQSDIGSAQKQVDWQQVAMAATVDSIGLLHFRTDLKQISMLAGNTKPTSELGDVAQIMNKITTEGQKLMLPSFINKSLPKMVPGYQAYYDSIGQLDVMVNDVIKKRLAQGFTDQDTDALGEILKVYGKEGYEWLTQDLVRDQLVTLFFAGSDTTASTVSWALYELSKNPEIYEKVTQEVDKMIQEKCGGDPSRISVDCLSDLPWLDGCINETLRLYPPAPIIGRDAIRDNNIVEGFLTKTKDVVIVDIYGLHRNPSLWDAPMKWDPCRWTEGKVLHPEAFIPFAAGPRACIGKYFALREAQVFLSVLLHHFKYAAGDEAPEIAHAITITSMNGINLSTKTR